MDRSIHVPDMNPADIPALSEEIYQAMGEDNIFAMLRDFYIELEKSPIRFLFAEDMEAASKRSAAFYVQLLGGPPLYNQRYGNPMMRRRHMPFEIDEDKRAIWAGCFYRVLEHATERYAFPADHLPEFRSFIDGFSRWMVNTSS